MRIRDFLRLSIDVVAMRDAFAGVAGNMLERRHDAVRSLTGLVMVPLALSLRERAQTFTITHSMLIYIA
jgi:hypothetical protein